MSDIHAVTYARHGHRTWRRHDNYFFAGSDALCQLGASELPKAMMGAPIALFPQDDGFVPVMVQGLQPDSNLLVSGKGFWRGRYLPRIYRAYPFMLAGSGDNEYVLCIDESSGVIADGDDVKAQRFFSDEDNPSDSTKSILEFLHESQSDSRSSRELCAQLHRLELIEPWSLAVEMGGDNIKVNGLYRVNETRLNGLPAGDLAALRDSRALIVAYCQLLSMSHIEGLGKLLREQSPPEAAELNFEPSASEGSISFDNL